MHTINLQLTGKIPIELDFGSSLLLYYDPMSFSCRNKYEGRIAFKTVVCGVDYTFFIRTIL